MTRPELDRMLEQAVADAVGVPYRAKPKHIHGAKALALAARRPSPVAAAAGDARFRPGIAPRLICFSFSSR